MKTPEKRLRLENRSKYRGYTLNSTSSAESLEETPQPSDKAFFENCISKRKPCILRGYPLSALTTRVIKDSCKDCQVQVERRKSANESYGQARSKERQAEMTVQDLMTYLRSPTDRELYYLSTQETEDVFSGPSKALVDKKLIPETISLAGNLLLHSCNLWMGASTNSSSGLHHDFHDNFYFLVSGTKQFQLWSPDVALDLPMHGIIETVHENGMISYTSNPLRADGYPLSSKEWNEEESDEESVAVFGKGFEDDLDEDEVDSAGPDDFDEWDQQESQEDSKPVALEKSMPNHFCKLDPTKAKLDGFSVEVTLQAGDCLYLPAGWLHCVTSTRDDKESLHAALNYWFYAPDNLESFANPYRHDDWKQKHQT